MRLLVSLLAVSALVLSACGDDDDVSADDTSTSTAEVPDTEQPGEFDIYLTPAELGDDCSEVVPVPRTATVEGDLGDALAQLLAGPTAEEEAQGLTSWFSSETEGMLAGAVVEGGLAEVDFQDFSGIIPNASSSCGSASLLAQLDSTVLQFPDVERVVYSFDGDSEAFYSWLQMDVPGS
jgi:spore germination protein GerM